MSREIGLSRLTVFELTNVNTPEYGTAKSIPWVVNVDVSKTIADYAAYADNTAEISSSKVTGASLTIEVSSDMPPSLEAELTGSTFKDGLFIEGTDDTKKQFGVAYETVLDTGKVRKYFFTNCTISKNEQSNETVSDSINAQTYTLTVKASSLPTTKELMFVMDESDYDTTIANLNSDEGKKTKVQNLWNKWFTEAPKSSSLS